HQQVPPAGRDVVEVQDLTGRQDGRVGVLRVPGNRIVLGVVGLILDQVRDLGVEVGGNGANLRVQNPRAEILDVEGQLFIGHRNRVVDVPVQGDGDRVL